MLYYTTKLFFLGNKGFCGRCEAEYEKRITLHVIKYIFKVLSNQPEGIKTFFCKNILFVREIIFFLVGK